MFNEMVGIFVSLPKVVVDGFDYTNELRPPDKGEYVLTMVRSNVKGKLMYDVQQVDKDLSLAYFIMKRTKPCLKLV